MLKPAIWSSFMTSLVMLVAALALAALARPQADPLIAILVRASAVLFVVGLGFLLWAFIRSRTRNGGG